MATDSNGNTIPDVPVTPEAPATPNPAPATPKPEETVQYWKEQYNGKNGTAVKLQRQNESLALEKENLQGRLSLIEVESQAKVQAAEEARNTAIQEAASAKAEAAQFQKANAVRTIAAAPEYKNAAALLDEDDYKLLAGMPEDQVKAYLVRQESKLSKFVTGTNEERNLGNLPQGAPAGERQNSQTDLKQLATELEAATAKFGFGSKEYQVAFDNHLRGVMASSKPS